MARELQVVDVDHAEGFAAVAESIRWVAGEAPADLCVIQTKGELGALALRAVGDRGEIRAVLSFVDLLPGTDSLEVPRNLDQVARLTGNIPTVQNPHVAKGIGILGGNTAGAVASHYVRGSEAAVRVIKVDGRADILVDPDQTILGGISSHARLMRRSFSGDGDRTNTRNMGGTTQIIRERSMQLGGRACALMSLSSVNRLWQGLCIEPEKARRGHVLASGDTAAPYSIDKVGIADIPQKVPLLRRRHSN